jgi:hypothetical protein
MEKTDILFVIYIYYLKYVFYCNFPKLKNIFVQNFNIIFDFITIIDGHKAHNAAITKLLWLEDKKILITASKDKSIKVKTYNIN